MRVLVFGDSIAYGAWDTEGGWVERLKQDAHSQTVNSKGATKLQVLNLGVGGDSSTKILKRLQVEIDARRSTSWPFIFVFTFGANDERSVDGKPETPIEQFRSNVEKIIETAKKYTQKILFVGTPPLGRPTILFKGQEYSDERIREYEKCLCSVLQKYYVTFVPIRPVFEQAELQDLYSYDHLHPNNTGHKLIAAEVKKELSSLLA